MKKLLLLLNELENKIPFSDRLNESVSSATVGWHIEHTLLATNKISHAVIASNPEEYKWKFNKIRTLIFLINRIPRGRGKAPKVAQPQGEITVENLKKNFELTKKKVAELNELSSRKHFDHPYFGKLNLKSTIWFLKIHITHHLKIIDDILRK